MPARMAAGLFLFGALRRARRGRNSLIGRSQISPCRTSSSFRQLPTPSSSCPAISPSRRSSGASRSGTTNQPLDLESFDDAGPPTASGGASHLSDVHLVGERYGFRIESGRAGPRGNGRSLRAMERLAALHAAEPLDLVLISGDMTDAQMPAEWGSFSTSSRLIRLGRRMLLSPATTTNIVDRTNPAQLDLPFSPVQDAASSACAVGDRCGPGRTRAPASRAKHPDRRARTATGHARSLRGHRRLQPFRAPCPALAPISFR